MDTNTHKIYWMDSLKLLAALLVFSTHFLAEYAPKFLIHWDRGHIFYGISGKLAVSFFFLMSGYFAMKAKRENTWMYVVKRYLRLAVPVFMIEIVVLFLMLCFKLSAVDTWASAEITGRYLKLDNMNYQMFLADIFLLNGKVIVTYWGNFMLFAGSVIVVLLHGACRDKKMYAEKNENFKSAILFAAATFLFFLLGYAWYAVCMMGALLYLLLSGERIVLKNRIAKALLLVAIYFCVRTPETNTGYVLKGLASFALVAFIFYTKKMQTILENKICRSLSKYSFEIYLVHTPVNLTIIPFIFGLMKELGINNRLVLVCTYLMSLGLTLLCSRGIHSVSDRVVKVIYGRIE